MFLANKNCKMNIINIHNNTTKPVLYEKGNSVMWTDEHISKQMLHVHLSQETDLASRKLDTINSTVEWVLSNTEKKELSILDLGCGPGLYSEILAIKGHKVTGIDFSDNSINYARKEAEKKKLNINYLKQNYLELDLEENAFDLVMLIFTDFGPLLPKEREQLIINVKKVLKPGGIFIFDVLNEQNTNEKITPRNWETAENGFWKNSPYIALSESFLYKENKVILYQHVIIDQKENINTYRFWIHFFSHTDLEEILYEHDFNSISFNEDVLPDGELYNGTNVTFCKSINVK